MKTTRHAIKNALPKLFGSAGYVAWVLQFLVLIALYFERFHASSVGKVIFPAPDDAVTNAPDPVTGYAISLPSSGLFTALMLAIGVAFICLVIYVIVMRYIPTVNRNASKAVHVTAEQTIKQVERVSHKKFPTRKRRMLTVRVIWWLKLGISIMPLIVVLFVVGTPLIAKEVAVMIVGALSLWANVCFTVQAVLVHAWRKNAQVDEL